MIEMQNNCQAAAKTIIEAWRRHHDEVRPTRASANSTQRPVKPAAKALRSCQIVGRTETRLGHRQKHHALVRRPPSKAAAIFLA
jgi:hypothetical protein